MSELNAQLAWLTEAEKSPEYAAEHVKMDFAVGVERRMAQVGMSRADLARRLGTSAAAVTMALRGDANLTIDRMVRMAHALDATVHVHLAAKSCRVKWYEVHDGARKEQITNAQTWAKMQKEGGHGQAIPIAA